MAIKMTPGIARAIGQDAGNASARASGRSAWNEDDYNAAVRAERQAMPLEQFYEAKGYPPEIARELAESHRAADAS